MSLENALARIAARVEALEADNTRLSAGQTNIFGRLEALEKWVDAVENPPDCPPSEPMTYDAPSPAVPTLATTLEGIVRWLEPKDPRLLFMVQRMGDGTIVVETLSVRVELPRPVSADEAYARMEEATG